MSDRTPVELARVTIRGFRAFPAESSLELGRVTVLCGPNGLGKTSVFDAIDWALFGEHWRLGDEGVECLRNLWHTSHSPKVQLATTGGTLTRTGASAELNGSTFRVSDLAVDPSVYDRAKNVAFALRRLAYLPQHEIRRLVESGDESKSFVLAALAGVPHSERFARNLENTGGDIRSRSRALEAEEDSVVQRLSELKERATSVATAANRERQVREEIAGLLQVELGPLSSMRGSLEEYLAARAAEIAQLRDRHRVLAGLQRRRETCVAQAVASESLLPALLQERALATAAAEEHERNVLVEVARRASVAELLERAEGGVATLTVKLEAARNAVARREQLGQLRASEASAVAHAAALRARIAELEPKLSSLAAVLAEARAAHRRATEQRALAMEQLKARDGAQEDHDAKQAAVALAEVQAALVAEEREKARTDHDRVSDALNSEREKAGKSRRRSERLASLLLELASLDELADGICPVCSHDHGAGDALKKRIEATIAEVRGMSVRATRIAELERDLARVTARRTEVERRSNVVAQELKDAELAYAAAASALVRVQEPLAGRDSAIAMAEAEATEKALLVAIKDHEDLGQVLDSELRTLDELDRGLDAMRRQIRELSAQHAEAQQAPAGEPASLEDNLRRLRAQVVEAQRGLEQLDGALVRLRGRSRELTERLATARAAVERASTEREIVRDEERALEREFARVGLAEQGANGDIIANSIIELTGSIQAEEERLRRARDLQKRAEIVLGEVTSSTIERELEELTVRASALDARRMSLARASERLRSIGAVVQSAVENELKRSQTRCRGTIDSVMRILAPHRHLNGVEIGGGGEVLLRDDELANPVAAHVYSSAGQINCIALAVFLGIGLNARSSRLRCMMLDEPVQNLDDVNVLNFLDLLRHVARTHQVIVSTANANLAKLLEVKLGPWALAESQRVVIHEFQDFSRATGPLVHTKVSRQSSEQTPGFVSSSSPSGSLGHG